MKYRTNTRDNLFRIFTAVLISMLLCFGMCACGDEGKPLVHRYADTATAKAFQAIVDAIQVGK